MVARRGRFLVVAGATLSFVTGLRGIGLPAQQTSQNTPQNLVGTGVIAGRVVDAAFGQPVPGALVELSLESVTRAQDTGDGFTGTLLNTARGVVQISKPPSAISMIADGSGQFSFRSLPAGKYSFFVSATGFAAGGYNQRRSTGDSQSLTLNADQHLSDVTINLWRLGAISGVVVDEAGEPVVGAFVRVVQRATSGGQPVLRMSGAGRATDDRGFYRAQGLDPGDYLVFVPVTQTSIPLQTDAAPAARGGAAGPRGVGPAANTGQQIGDLLLTTAGQRGMGRAAVGPPPDASGRFAAYQTTFYPSAPSSGRATVLTVAAGEEKTGVDIQLTLTPTFRVSGTLTTPDGQRASGYIVHLVPPDDAWNAASPDDIATTTSDAGGSFTLLGVPPGQYQLLAANRIVGGARGAGVAMPGRGTAAMTAPMAWANAPVTVADTDVTNLALALRGGLQVRGRVVYDGSTPPPTPEQLQQRQLRLQPAAGRGRMGGVPSPGTVGADGAFAITEILPGRYTLAASGWLQLKWFLKSITIEGRDASDAPIEIGTSDVSNVVVTFTDRPAQVSGTARSARGDADPNALVIMFPTDSRGWGTQSIVHTANTRVAADGTFSIGALAPGEYFIAAIADDTARNWQDPKVLQALSSTADRIRLADGDRQTRDLKTRSIR